MSVMTLTEAIHTALQYEHVTYSGLSPEQINDGFCYDFAEQVHALVPGVPIVWSCDLDPVLDERAGMCHAVLLYKGRFYDSEAPEGVATLYDLPFFQRALGGNYLVTPNR